MNFRRKILSAVLSASVILSSFAMNVSAQESFSADSAKITSIEISTANSNSSKVVKKLTYDNFALSDVPKYNGNAYIEINKNMPFFYKSELTEMAFEKYSTLDDLGRCGAAYACVGKEIMPTEERGKIGSVKPTGWHTVKYDSVDGKYLYNRCHLIGYQLSGENANEKNLITGTRYMNTEGMLPFENMVADYVKETGNHVLYRVTPMFEGDNLLASGVLMEGYSVEDSGAGICFNVFCYNVQPNIKISYSDGKSSYIGKTAVTEKTKTTTVGTSAENSQTYILNTNTKKFHKLSCSSVKQMSDKNKQSFTGSRDEAISKGYSPCKRCKP